MEIRFSTIFFGIISKIACEKKKIVGTMFIALSFILLSIPQADAYIVYYNDFEDDVVDLSGWSISADSETNSTITTDTAPNGYTFLGQFGGLDVVTLTLTGLYEGWVTVSLDTYFIRSWDGNADENLYGSDYFTVTTSTLLASNEYLLYESFSNGNPFGQSYEEGDRVYPYLEGDNNSMQGSEGQYELGYYFYDVPNSDKYSVDPIPSYYDIYLGETMDSIYNFVFSFYNTSDYLELIFAGVNLQSSIVTDNGGNSYIDESWGLDNVSVKVASVPEPPTLLLLASGAFGLIPLSRRRKRN